MHKYWFIQIKTQFDEKRDAVSTHSNADCLLNCKSSFIFVSVRMEYINLYNKTLWYSNSSKLTLSKVFDWTYIFLCLVDVFFSRQSALLWVLTAPLFSSNCVFICMNQYLCMRFIWKLKTSSFHWIMKYCRYRKIYVQSNTFDNVSFELFEYQRVLL
jgi:hypothetical protein